MIFCRSILFDKNIKIEDVLIMQTSKSISFIKICVVTDLLCVLLYFGILVSVTLVGCSIEFPFLVCFIWYTN